MTMTPEIDLNIILTPIPGENPAGVYLRYDPVYDAIGEARRADDDLNRGEWQREIKTADWDTVTKLSVEALSQKTKDLQIAAWLTEALTATRGFEGLAIGLKIINGFLTQFWPHFFPQMEDGNLDHRVGRIEFLNNAVFVLIQQIPLTDPAKTKGYSLLKWRESRLVGSESGSANWTLRNQLIDEGKLTAEEFDSAAAESGRNFYDPLAECLTACLAEFKILDGLIDEHFGNNTPKTSDFKKVLDECDQIISKIIKEKHKEELDSASLSPEALLESASKKSDISISDAQYQEKAIWENTMAVFNTSGIRPALEQLMSASFNAPSIRERTRHRLFMAKLCLKAQRPDLARPIIEELHALVDQMKLEFWESPLWIGEVLETLYQCLIFGSPNDEDRNHAVEVLRRLCKTDITKAMSYRG